MILSGSPNFLKMLIRVSNSVTKMKYIKLFLLISAIFLSGAVATSAQDGPPPDEAKPAGGDRPEMHRPNLLAALGLSPEQVQEIRRINQERRPQMMRAQRRMREANRDLDMAIYADNYSDADVQARLKEFQTAEADLARLRFESEFAVRKVLSPEQLVKFRGLREQFAKQRRENMQERREQRRDGRGFAPRRNAPNRPVN